MALLIRGGNICLSKLHHQNSIYAKFNALIADNYN